MKNPANPYETWCEPEELSEAEWQRLGELHTLLGETPPVATPTDLEEYRLLWLRAQAQHRVT